jgi:molybdenum cofactor biosynthesis protein B
MDSSHIQDVRVAAGIITVSTSRTEKDDISGETIRCLLREANIPVVFTRVVPDDVASIRAAAEEALGTANCIIITGGTGLTPDDVTIEAIDPMLEKKMDGFGELFRHLSYGEIGTRALLSRATGGVVKGRAVFCIPGSPAAVRLATGSLIIPEIRHILTHARI